MNPLLSTTLCLTWVGLLMVAGTLLRFGYLPWEMIHG